MKNRGSKKRGSKKYIKHEEYMISMKSREMHDTQMPPNPVHDMRNRTQSKKQTKSAKTSARNEGLGKSKDKRSQGRKHPTTTAQSSSTLSRNPEVATV